MTKAESDPPQRRSRFKIVVGVLVATLLTLLLLRALWGTVAQRRLDRAMASTRPAPTTLTELYPATDPDLANNAVPLLLEAIAAAKAADDAGIYCPSGSNLGYAGYPPFPPAWHQLADAAFANADNRRALALGRQARGKSKFFWSAASASPPSGENLSLLNGARNLANLLGDAALHSNLHDPNDLEALALMRDLRHLCRAVDAQHTLIAHLVRIGIDALGAHRIMVLAPDLRVPPADGPAGEESPVRQSVRDLIAELLDTTEPAQAGRDAWTAERVSHIDTMRTATQSVWALRPMYELDLVRVLDADALRMRAAFADSLPAARDLMRQSPTFAAISQLNARVRSSSRRPGIPRYSRLMSQAMAGHLGRVLNTEMRARSERRCAAISLAAQLYRADHHGAWPPSLGALVPGYLPSVPADPLARNRAMQYVLLKSALSDGSDRPLVYSVGENGEDGTIRSGQAPPTMPEYGWSNVGPKFDDQYRDLARWPTSGATTNSTTNPTSAPAKR